MWTRTLKFVTTRWRNIRDPIRSFEPSFGLPVPRTIWAYIRSRDIVSNENRSRFSRFKVFSSNNYIRYCKKKKRFILKFVLSRSFSYIINIQIYIYNLQIWRFTIWHTSLTYHFLLLQKRPNSRPPRAERQYRPIPFVTVETNGPGDFDPVLVFVFLLWDPHDLTEWPMDIQTKARDFDISVQMSKFTTNWDLFRGGMCLCVCVCLSVCDGK